MNVAEVCTQFEQIAPLRGAQSWDNVGLLAGDEQADCSAVLLCIDLTDNVLDEAIAGGFEMIMAYHPTLFRPISSIRANSSGTDRLLWRAIRGGIAVYSLHTALDAAEGGTNDVLAKLCGATELTPFEFVDGTAPQSKIVVFAPPNECDAIAAAMSAAGAGIIGEYRDCSFRIPGTGTFKGTAASQPTIGQAGQYETTNEIRLEMVVPQSQIAAAIAAMKATHSYEEPAFDIYPLTPAPAPGIGRIGQLQAPSTLGQLVDTLMANTPTTAPCIVGSAALHIDRVVVCAGAAGDLPFKVGLRVGDCVVTGEIRHHDALSLQRIGVAGIALGHWASERPALDVLAASLSDRLAGVHVAISEHDCDPMPGAHK